MVGNIVRLITQKQFGFIRAGKAEYFFHKDDYLGDWSDLVGAYQTKDGELEVEFDAKETPKGKRAENVQRTIEIS